MIERQQIEGLFKEQLARIQDEQLRLQIVEVWLLGCKDGGWDSIEDLKQMPFTLLTDTRGVNFIEHTLAVTEGAIGLAVAMKKHYQQLPHPIDMDRLIAGGLLHDVGKLLEIEKDGKGGWRKSLSGKCARHPISGAMLGARVGLPEKLINVIGCHAKEGDGRPQVIETVLVHQADFATFNPLVMLQAGNLIEP
ncbi:MAG: HD domain-containing protein [Candidatus Eisenbacteria sp.]|nr:HD domain-containing protein [Candidatus Eisenbacteria bacterium]